ncbi:SRPBCC family protein [Nocardioides sp.]|uniref:SRPBCC family protein n=1 Tax=Nocardioides sp. TaxID=35761 RepID=UPI0035653FDC
MPPAADQRGSADDVDVRVSTLIARSPADVAAYSGDPTNAPAWYENIRTVEWRTEPPLRVGSRMDFTARFLGRQLNYTYEVVELVPGERLVMETSQGPFPMRTTYTWTPEGPGTRMTLRNTGRATGFSKLAAPALSSAMRRATTKDLTALKKILEA